MPDNVMNEWDALRNHIEETTVAEQKIKSRFDFKDLCTFFSLNINVMFKKVN